MLSYDEAIARVTAPGERFETTEVDIRGVTYTIFRNAPRSLREIVATTRARGDDVFLVYEDERWSFAEFASKVDALASALVDRYGVAKGDRVAIGMRNYPEWVVAFAPSRPSARSRVSLNAWWTSDELDYALEDCGASVLIADAERVERSADTCKRLGIDVIAVRAPDAGPDASISGTTSSCPGAPMPDVDDRPRRRRHHPLHVRHDGKPEGRGVHPPRRRPGADGLRLPVGCRPAAQPRRDADAPTRRRSSSSCRCSTSPVACP